MKLKETITKILSGISNCYKMIFSLDQRLDKIEKNQAEINKALIQIVKHCKKSDDVEQSLFRPDKPDKPQKRD